MREVYSKVKKQPYPHVVPLQKDVAVETGSARNELEGTLENTISVIYEGNNY
jgi:hypothetical protein